MSEITKFFTEFQHETLLSVSTLAPGKVIKFDEARQRADIQPLFLTADKNDNVYKQSIIHDALVPDHLTSIEMFEKHECSWAACDCDSVLKKYAEWRKLKAGNLVFYIPAQRSLGDLNGTNFIDPDSHDLMSSNDAVVVGRFLV